MSTILLLFVAMAAADRIIFDKTKNSRHSCNVDKSRYTSSTFIDCSLPSAALSIIVSASLDVNISCDKHRTIACDELQEVKEFLDGHLTTNTTTFNKELGTIISSCDVSPDTACLPNVFGVGFAKVFLRRFRGQLQPRHLKGFMFVTYLSISFDKDYDDIQLAIMPYNTLSILPKLQNFIISDTLLEIKSDQGLLPELTNLDVNFCYIRMLPKGSFKSTPNLQILRLFKNNIQFIDHDAFEGLKNLVKVDLYGNTIKHLPGGLFRYSPRVRKFEIRYNDIQSHKLAEELFSSIHEIEEGRIIEEDKTPFTSETRIVANIKPFQKSNTADLLLNTMNLRMVSLIHNEIKIVPSKSFSHVQLLYLNLRDNLIEYLPADVFIEQATLEELDLQNNRLESLPEGLFTKLGSLKMLSLGNNLLKKLNNQVFNGLNNLKSLYLYTNRIEDIEDSVFEAVPNLEIISLTGNNLTISTDKNTRKNYNSQYASCDSPLSVLPNLRVIHLGNNNVTIICDDWRNKSHLEMLDLSYNSITSFTDHNWRNLRASHLTVDLRHNNIRHIQSSKLYGEAQTFLLDSNPYNCDCMLYDFIILHQTRRNNSGGLLLGDAECSQPNSLRGTKLINLNPDYLTCNDKCQINNEITPINCYSCTQRPSKSRVEMICNKFPDAYPLREGIASIHIRVEQPSNIPALPPQVRFIDLSHLSLTEPPVASGVELNLTYNNLTRAPIASLEGNCTLHLKNNSFICTCEGRTDIAMLQKYKNQIIDYKLLTCSDNNFVSNVHVDQLCGARDGLVISFSLMFSGIILVVIIAVIYRYRVEVRIKLRNYCLWWGESNRCGLYDAYISYSSEDEEYVKTHLVPMLEGGRRSLRLCLPYRHWTIGGFIPELIAESIDQSHRTVIVLSKYYLTFDWGRVNFKLAHFKGKIIVLMLDDLLGDKLLDPEIHKYIITNPVFKASDKLVYERIRDRVLRSQTREKNIMYKSRDKAETEEGTDDKECSIKMGGVSSHHCVVNRII